MRAATTAVAPLRGLVLRSASWAGAGVGFALFAWAADRQAAATEGFATPGPWSYLVLAAIAVLAAGWSVAGVLRMHRLARRAGPAFAMQARITRNGRRGLVHLFPLDAPADAAPLCTVPLVAPPAGLPRGVRFGVEVKGAPRPRGRLAVRCGAVLLPTSGRALASTRAPVD